MTDGISESIPKEIFELPSEKEPPPPVKKRGLSLITDSIGKHPEWMYVPGGILVCGILVAKRKKIFQSNSQSRGLADGSVTQSEESISGEDSNSSQNLSSKKSSVSASPSSMIRPSPVRVSSLQEDPTRITRQIPTTSTQQLPLQTAERQPSRNSEPLKQHARRYSLPTLEKTTDKTFLQTRGLAGPAHQRFTYNLKEPSKPRSPSPTTPSKLISSQITESDIKPPMIVFHPPIQSEVHVTHFKAQPSSEPRSTRSPSPTGVRPLQQPNSPKSQESSSSSSNTRPAQSESSVNSKSMPPSPKPLPVKGMNPSERESRAKTEKPSFQDLICNETKQGMIRKIVETLHATNALAMAGKAAELTEIGKQIQDVHTLCFLWTIFKDPGLKEKLNFIFNSFWWKPQKSGFMGGVNGKQGMTRYTPATLDPYLEDWAQRLGTTKQAVAPLIQSGFKKSDWTELVEHLIKTPAQIKRSE